MTMSAGKKIAVAGATGRLGRHVVNVLKERGHDVVPMSRATGVDIVTGAGLADALAGVDVVIDAASTPSPDRQEATEFFTAAARNLHEAGHKAGVRRMVVVSIIGIDGSTTGYNAAKLEHERAVLAGPVPTRVLRAAQFHEFVEQLAQWGRQGDTVYVPRMRTQLVAARAVAEALVDLAEAEDAPGARAPFPEVAGPREESLEDAVRLLLARREPSVKVAAVSDTDDSQRDLFEGGGLLPGAGARLAGPTYEEWVAAEAE
ncbi:SDR family oxidoreductase [Streptomyces sp. HUCO-GS316]|uniref:SDR family oxidoreductase n=1 Tax=Streptomyces sp. HUCO-GS316 TaxID=2692198 RepID=UPI0019259C56|nr:NAD(P)H-binding protein [Streptomyces sp. HUCO-GS316]